LRGGHDSGSLPPCELKRRGLLCAGPHAGSASRLCPGLAFRKASSYECSS
jgi:hypothetical protein